MIETRVTEAFGLYTPILSAGMAFVSRPHLAAAVSNAGGMGFVGADMTPPDGVARLIATTRSLTPRAFGVDFMVPFFTEEHLNACLEEPAAVVNFLWGYPNWEWVEKLQEAGAKVWMKVNSLDEAKGALQCGLDGLVVEAVQGGPSRHAPSLMSLLPSIVDAVRLPVIASANILDGRGLAASLALGAEAVRCGTRFLTAAEADAQSEYDRRFGPATIDGTVLTELFSREWPEDSMPVVKNRAFADGSSGSAAVMSKLSAVLTPENDEERIENTFYASESGEAERNIQPAAEILEEMTREAEQILARYTTLVAVA
jgi:NAD(P)H-dependent flavin oxidoreductase YrpB (nitropropane dioxygenase family)